MAKELQTSRSSLYETDYLQWIETIAAQLERKEFSQIDLENLIDEIKDMGRSERQSLESNLVVVLTHLLKWQYQPEQRSGSWKGSLTEHRRRLNRSLKESPSLKPYLAEVLAECYTDARRLASDETELPIATFPIATPYSISQILEVDFLKA